VGTAASAVAVGGAMGIAQAFVPSVGPNTHIGGDFVNGDQGTY
jgi:hypothetical protein